MDAPVIGPANKASRAITAPTAIPAVMPFSFAPVETLRMTSIRNQVRMISSTNDCKAGPAGCDPPRSCSMPELYFCSGFGLFPTGDMTPISVLFVCVHNSARSQMAEAYLNHLGEGRFEAESAGLEPGTLNPRVVQVMKEDGIDLSGNQTKSVFDLFKRGGLYSFMVTVCDETSAEKCPIFPGVGQRLHWSFEDPSSLSGTEDQKLERTRKIRDEIKRKVKSWIDGLSVA